MLPIGVGLLPRVAVALSLSESESESFAFSFWFWFSALATGLPGWLWLEFTPFARMSCAIKLGDTSVFKARNNSVGVMGSRPEWPNSGSGSGSGSGSCPRTNMAPGTVKVLLDLAAAAWLEFVDW